MILNKFIIQLSKVLLNPWGMLEGIVEAEGQTYTPQPYAEMTKLMCFAVFTAVQAGAKCNNTLTNLRFNILGY